MFRNSIITGSGRFLPEHIVANTAFVQNPFYLSNGEPLPNSNTEVIEKFEAITGIEERRYASDDYVSSDMATEAARKAIESAQIDKETIDCIIVANNFGDVAANSHQPDFLPSLAARVKHNLEITNPSCVAFDIVFGCPGWVQAMIQADIMLQSGAAEKCLVIGSELLSRVVDPTDRDMMIFADGAGAVVLEAIEEESKRGVLATAAQSHTGPEVKYLSLGKPNYQLNGSRDRYVKMQGRKIYEYALKHVPAAMSHCLETAKVAIDQLNKILIHQANEKMDEAIIERFYGIYNEEVPQGIMPMTIDKFGNSSVATIPTMYDLIIREEMPGHHFAPGHHLLMASVGAGMNINAIVYKV